MNINPSKHEPYELPSHLLRSVHTRRQVAATCRCDVSPHLVAATSRPTCTHGVFCRRDLLQQPVA